MKKKVTIISLILILLVLFTPFQRYSYIAEGVLVGYSSLIASVSICGNSTINSETGEETTKYKGIKVYILFFEILNTCDDEERI